LDVVLFLILVNVIGYLLKYFGLDRFLIFLGFRFHLALVLPFLFLIFKKRVEKFKSEIKKFELKRFINHFSLVIIPIGVLVFVAFILKLIDLADPDYFYEFGLSSIFDYPVYFVWNLPQLLMAAIFLKYIRDCYKLKYLVCFLILMFLFAYEFIPVQKAKFSLYPFYDFLSFVILTTLIIVNAKNIYSFAISVYTFLWSTILLFGSKESPLIRILFARNYDSWEGFFELPKSFANYSFVIQVGFTFLFYMIYYIFTGRRKVL
jgi:hypothetical protein